MAAGRRKIDLAKLADELTARIDGFRLDCADGSTWEASPADRGDEISMVRLTQDGAQEWRRIRVRLDEASPL